jgi:pimeloyl-ACP methyl ester carboxylesterase
VLRMLATGTIVLTAMLAAGDGAAAAGRQFTAKPCLEDIRATGREVGCGTLTVAEDRSKSGGRRIRLEVAIVKARHPRRGLPPVIYLQGGPGAEVIRELPRLLTRSPVAALIGAEQDWIFFDARGVGLSSPALDCPGAQLTDAGPASDESVRQLLACIAGHASIGVDLSHYNSTEVARDVQDLRSALGLRQFDLFGVSGGTTVAATLQRDFPQGIRAVVQDSPWPPEAPWTTATPRAVADTARLILSKCAAQPGCSASYPGGEAALEEVARSWLRSPPTFRGRPYTAEDLGIFLMDAAYFTAATFPGDLRRIAAGDLTPIERSLGERSYYYEAQHLAHLCREEIPFEQPRDLIGAARGDPVSELLVPSLRRLFQLCAQADVGPPAPTAIRPVRSSIPTLFLVAEVDPGNAPNMRRSVAGYANAQLIVVANATHVTIKTACGRELTTAFLRAPHEPVVPACAQEAGTPFAFAVE